MSSNRYHPSPTAMARRLGQHLLLSLGVATAAALLATLPGHLSSSALDHGRVQAPADQPTLSKLVVLKDGKIVDRLDSVGSGNLTAGSWGTPAALAMPMSVSWPDGGEWAPAQLAGQRNKSGEGAASSQARRTASLPARSPATAGPLMILPAATAAAIEAVPTTEASRDDSWSRFLIAPATKVADAVSGAAGNVQAVGSWGLSQATSLLPRW